MKTHTPITSSIHLSAAEAPFHLGEAIHDLKHYLPAQAPLKDFIHHNTLHAFQTTTFFTALHKANEMFGYKVSLSLEEYRYLFQSKKISEQIVRKTIIEEKGEQQLVPWMNKLLRETYSSPPAPKIGLLRAFWKSQYKIDLDATIHPILFRLLCSYLDQGIAIWKFPVHHKGFLESLCELEKNSTVSLFNTSRARELLLQPEKSLLHLLKLLIGEERYFKQYIFDQQFAHQGWSGIVSFVENEPQSLLDKRIISMHDLIFVETLFEIDALDHELGENNWNKLSSLLPETVPDLFCNTTAPESVDVLNLWQLAFEWTYYDQVLAGLALQKPKKEIRTPLSFQALFCIDDRECSLRRYLEESGTTCETFGTPGFFGVEFFFQPAGGKFYTKLCPAPVNPRFLIKETAMHPDSSEEMHFSKPAQTLFGGWLISQTLGYWSALKLFLNMFNPSLSPSTASSFRHMDKYSKLSIEHHSEQENGLQIGFTIDEMADRVEVLLKSIGLTKYFAPMVYVVGHGSSSVNNPHYAAYDCGACSGRPGSVNARVLSQMANHPCVREILSTKGIHIPAQTQFIGALHDTTQDEIVFYDEELLFTENAKLHLQHEAVFKHALDLNAKERSRRFGLMDTHSSSEKIHKKLRKRALSLFEPRPELNHATNALCIIGSRNLSRDLFLDRRSFLNSYDYRQDLDGKYLLTILKAAAPVCGGINLEYFFSRVDNQKLGAGTKLPHNVMGLFGVANGIEGDLRPGLPSQMIEIHDPVRLLIIVEQFPEVVLSVMQQSPETYEWFIHEWIHLIAIDPESKKFFRFRNGSFVPYIPLSTQIPTVKDINHLIESASENIPVHVIQS